MNRGDEKIREVFAGWKAVNRLTAQDAAARTKIPESTWQRRQKDFGTMTLDEFRKLVEITRATDDDIIRMVTGRRRT